MTGPPQPRLALRIGVTGHRLDEVRLKSAEMPALERAIGDLLGTVAATLRAVQRENAGIFAEAGPALRVVSAIAEGADQAAARAALAQGVALNCPLPFPRAVYEQDFQAGPAREAFQALLARAGAVLELPGERAESDAAYETVGLVTLGQSDVLLAIWDGDLSEQRRGGTAEMVSRAIELGIPVLWLKPGATVSLFRIERAGFAGGSRWDLVAKAPAADAAAIDRLVRHLTEPPKDAPPPQAGHEPSLPARARLTGFLGEREAPSPYRPFAYRLMLWLLAPSRAVAPAVREDWSERLAPLRRQAPSMTEGIERILVPRYAWADRLSARLSHFYRSGYVTNFVLAAAAVLFALIGLVAFPELKPFWVSVELLMILAILIVTYVGTLRRWHDRWVDYRQLAERLRHLRFAAVTGSRAVEARVPHIEDDTQAGPAWVNWYFRATLREIPLAQARIDADFVAALRALLAAEIEDQRAYHGRNAERLRDLHDGLDRIGLVLLAITAGIGAAFVIGAGLHVFGEPMMETAREWVSFLCGTMPAAGAAAFGIRVHGDFKAASERSAAAAALLAQLGAVLAKEPQLSFARLSALSDEVTSVMITELSDWSFVYREKPLPLPS